LRKDLGVTLSELPHLTFIYKETGILPFKILNTGLKCGPDFYAVCIDGKYYLVQAKVKFSDFNYAQLLNKWFIMLRQVLEQIL